MSPDCVAYILQLCSLHNGHELHLSAPCIAVVLLYQHYKNIGLSGKCSNVQQWLAIILATSRIRWHSTASADPMNETPLLVVFFIHCDRALLVWNKTCSSPTTSSFRPCTANASAWHHSRQEMRFCCICKIFTAAKTAKYITMRRDCKCRHKLGWSLFHQCWTMSETTFLST